MNILAALVIIRRDSGSLFVVVAATSLLSVVDGVLPFVCLLSLELAAKERN